MDTLMECVALSMGCAENALFALFQLINGDFPGLMSTGLRQVFCVLAVFPSHHNNRYRTC